jgi:D-3-phosphoglycerate dehydrogenase
MRVLALEGYSQSALARLLAEPRLQVTQDSQTLPTTQALLVRSQTKVDNALLERAPHLRFIATATSGFDHIDWRACATRGIVVTHTPEANAQSTAELTLALLLACERQLIGARKNVRDNKWRQGLLRSEGLEGKDLGIVGLGRVGQRVAKMAQTFGMQVSVYDPYIEESVISDLGLHRLSFIELLKASDCVSLHVPLTTETKHMLNQPTFLEMQAEAILLNTCRGAVVDENDLLTALDEGTISGAAMDVIEREPPPPGHRVLTHPKLLLTPHIGAYTMRAWDKGSHEAVDKLLQFLNGGKVLDTLPLQTPWFEKT